MAASTGWMSRPPLLRLGLVSTAGMVVAVLCGESVALLGSGSALRLIAPGADAVAFGVVAGYCWLTSSSHVPSSVTEPLRHTRNGLASGLGILLAITVADSFSGERVGLPDGFRLPVAILAALVAGAFAWVAIVFVRREQAAFDSMDGSSARATNARPTLPLERMRATHGLVGAATAGAAVTLYAAGMSPYVFAFACLVLVPSVATWAYADLRTSRFEHRPLPQPSPKRPPDAFRTARLATVALLSLVPVGVFWWVWLSVGTWSSLAVESTGGMSGTDLVLAVTVVVGIAAATAYPFFAIAEALRTPLPEWEDDRAMDDVPEPVSASLGLSTLKVQGRGTGAA